MVNQEDEVVEQAQEEVVEVAASKSLHFEAVNLPNLSENHSSVPC